MSVTFWYELPSVKLVASYTYAYGISIFPFGVRYAVIWSKNDGAKTELLMQPPVNAGRHCSAQSYAGRDPARYTPHSRTYRLPTYARGGKNRSGQTSYWPDRA